MVMVHLDAGIVEDSGINNWDFGDSKDNYKNTAILN